MEFTDKVAQLSNTRTTKDGYLLVDALVGRTGIQLYRGAEMDHPDKPVIRVYRPEGEVFHSDALKSATHRPVTNNHPGEMVDATNWREHSVGITGDTVARDGEFIRLPFMLMDGDTIGQVQGGKRELSLGYYADIDWTPGETPEGEKYDAVQRDIRINHLAVVDAARAGPTCRIGDHWSKPPTPQEDNNTTRINREMPENLRNVMVDGITIPVTDQAAEAIAKLQKQISDATAAVSDRDAQLARLRDAHAGEVAALRTDHSKALEAKDGEITALKSTHQGTVDAMKSEHDKALGTKDGEIADLKSKLPDAAQMDALIAARSKVIDAARKLLGDKFDPAGKTEADIRRAAVQKRLGDAAVADKSDEYVQAAFDTLTAVGGTPSKDPVRDAIASGATHTNNDDSADAAYAAYEQTLSNGWKQPSLGQGA